MAIKVKIWQDWSRAGSCITIYEERNGKLYVAKPIKLELCELPEGHIHEPTIFLTRFHDNEFFQSILNEINELGIKPNSESFLRGELEATKFHLRDLRNLLKLK